jgi:hypothetical protein
VCSPRIRDFVQLSKFPTKVSICSTVLPACKQTLTRSVPIGTVGDTTARTIIPLFCKYPARALGSEVWIEKIGELGQVDGRVRPGREAVVRSLKRAFIILLRCAASYMNLALCTVYTCGDEDKERTGSVCPLMSNEYEARIAANAG